MSWEGEEESVDPRFTIFSLVVAARFFDQDCLILANLEVMLVLEDRGSQRR